MSGKMTWTDDQLKAIGFPSDSSACVTAAAGSGKTALLIERVVTLIRGDAEKGIPPVPGNKFAILTFTRNAAEEFRTRMTLAIDKASRSGGADAISREQLIKFRSSVISTINSFCLGVLKEHAELFGLPVNFSILEESKGLIMRRNALDNAMEYFYSPEFTEDFPEYYERFGGNISDDRNSIGNEARELLHKSFSFSTDDRLREAVSSIYLRSTSLADSNEWLDGCAEVFSSIELMEKRFLPVITEDLRRQCALLESALTRYRNMCAGADPEFSERFQAVYDEDEKAVRLLLNSFRNAFPCENEPRIADFEKFNSACPELSFGAFSRSGIPRNNPGYKELKAAVDTVRKRIKEYCADIREGCGYASDIAERELIPQHKAVTALIMLVRRLQMEYAELKRKAGVVDFADCERLLLDKLREEGCVLRQELAERYQCIILDEFQDTNDLQYEIFRLISRDQKNLFFVGDIKQSIYAFRGGNPEIMARCCAPGSGYERLPLNRNFRSRREVINTVNAMFDGVMTEKYGEVDYSDGNGLTPGAQFPETENRGEYLSEMYLLDFPAREKPSDAPPPEGSDAADDRKEQSDQLELEASNPVAEARFTAELIRKMAAEGFKLKRDGDSLRPCTWGDFAILLRSKTHFADYKSELEKLGIPVATDGGNYLSADEINLILNYLKIIDNPQLDEQLLSVLMSPLYGLTAEDLSLARLGILGYDTEALDKSGIDLDPLYDSFSGLSLFCCVCAAAQSDLSQTGYSETAREIIDRLSEMGISRSPDEKCSRFICHFSEFRRFAANNSVERLIRRIYNDTDFFSVISTYERGDRKLANIRLLLKYTADFESGGGGTLSDFLRYTDAVRETPGGLEEAVVPQEAADAVRILTFHASKGLQWKIVILGGLGTALHDERSSIIIDRKTGIGLKNTLIKQRLRTLTLSYNGAKASADTAQLGDELRLLYVAMTRAEEKLIMIGQITEKAAAECCTDSFSPEFALSGNTHLKWILSSMLRYRDDISDTAIPGLLSVPGLKLSWVNEKLPEPEETSAELPEEGEADEKTARRISEILSGQYAHEYETTLQSRFSVTQLAHRNETHEKPVGDIRLKKPEFLTPEKIGDIRINGILVGNTYHHIMELFPIESLKPDYPPEDMEAAVETEIDQLIEQKKLTPEECLCAGGGMHEVFVRKISAFFCGVLGRDMLSAQRIEREYEIFAELPAAELFPEECSGGSTTIIQGRVDMLFVKDGRVVVVDYKSDSKGSLEDEFGSYSTQLRLYRRILPMLMTECSGDNIDMVLYSFGQEQAYYIDS